MTNAYIKRHVNCPIIQKATHTEIVLRDPSETGISPCMVLLSSNFVFILQLKIQISNINWWNHSNQNTIGHFMATVMVPKILHSSSWCLSVLIHVLLFIKTLLKTGSQPTVVFWCLVTPAATLPVIRQSISRTLSLLLDFPNPLRNRLTSICRTRTLIISSYGIRGILTRKVS